MKYIFLLITIIAILIVVPFNFTQPDFNGTTPGCSGSGCHTLNPDDVSAIALNDTQVEITLSGVSSGSKVAGELVNQSGVVVAVNNSTSANPFVLTAPTPGVYKVNAGYKNPSKRWDSTTVNTVTITVPSAPSNLTGQVIQNPLSVDLNWSDNSDNEDGFYIERETVIADVYELIDSVGSNVTNYIDNNVVITVYNYRVSAFNSAGTSAYSNVSQIIVPVELTSFTAQVVSEGVLLKWATATETNNSGFEAQRNSNDGWTAISFIPGQGSSTNLNNYSYLDEINFTGEVNYRLKQIDLNGTFSYSYVINVLVNFKPDKYSLSQNYPNPFNPSTVIKFSIPEQTIVSLKIYDAIGNEAAVLVNERLETGNYSIMFEAADLTSGIYYYQIRTSQFVETRKMILIK